MKSLILDAPAGIGPELICQTIERGQSVAALVRGLDRF